MKTISMNPTKQFTEAGLERQGIRGITVNDDGTCTMTNEREAISSLVGTVLADDVYKNLAIPSHLAALNRTVDTLRGLRRMAHRQGVSTDLEEAIDDILNVINTLSKEDN